MLNNIAPCVEDFGLLFRCARKACAMVFGFAIALGVKLLDL